MKIGEELGYDIGVALNEAELIKIETFPGEGRVICELRVLSMDEHGEVDQNKILKLSFAPVGRFVVAYTTDLCQSPPGRHVDLGVEGIQTALESCPWGTLYGWEFLNWQESVLNWGNKRISFKF